LIKRQEAVGITVVTDGRLAPKGKKFFSEVIRWTKNIKRCRHPAGGDWPGAACGVHRTLHARPAD
jgi:hypothetical protein